MNNGRLQFSCQREQSELAQTLPSAAENLTGRVKFFNLVKAMREAQREYFSTRSHEALQKARSLERSVDAYIKRGDDYLKNKTKNQLYSIMTDNMRTIKFKAKRLDNGEWVKGDLLQYLDGTVYIGDNEGTWTDDGLCNSDYTHVEIVAPDTVCQFTGFLDKNGKEIYEGDVLRSDEYPYSCIGDKRRDNYYAVVYYCEEGACFGTVTAKNPSSDVGGISDGILDDVEREKMKNFEVIGNVHEDKWQQYGEYFKNEEKEVDND